MSSLFAGKAEQYARHRLDYPAAVMDSALAAIGLAATDVVADLGSGTGMLARWILERGNTVTGVEPDAGMRAAAEVALAAFGDRFSSVPGSAEATTLPDGSVDVITAGNAFHYFDPTRARAEANRILRPGGRVLIVGHSRAAHPNRFMQEYSRFLEGIASPEQWAFHRADREATSLRDFFAGHYQEHDAGQVSYQLSWDALCGRFLSTSLAPPESDPRRSKILERLHEMFDDCARKGVVEFQLRWQYQWQSLKQ
jgi:SAM-dependent methyltransferase